MPEMSTEVFTWFRRDQTTNYKVEIDSVEIPIKEIIEGRFTRAVTEEIGNFKLVLENSDGSYTDKYTGGEVVDFYADFADASHLAFKGNIEKWTQKETGNGYRLEITGNHIASKLLDITVTESYTAIAISTILTGLITSYASGFTSTNVETCSTTATVNWEHKPFWECVIDLCNLAGFDCYVDNSSDFHFFEAGTKEMGDDEAVVWHDNLIKTTGLSTDTFDIINRVTVYGEDDQGLPIIYTAENTASQSDLWKKEKIIKDTKINTMTEAQERGDAELALTTPLKGEVKSSILPKLRPGHKMWIDDPAQHIRNKYKVLKFTHKIPIEETDCIVTKHKTIPYVLKASMRKELALEEIGNPNKLEFSYNFPFADDSNIDSTSYTEISGGYLQLQTEQTSGNMVSSVKTAANNISEIELRMISEGEVSVEYRLSSSFDWRSLTRNAVTETVNVGKSLQIRVNLTASGAKVDSVAILYK